MSLTGEGNPSADSAAGRSRRVEVIGGGPGGMYAARLLKLRHPHWNVTVHERNIPDVTFGFGIGLSPATLRRMQSADSATYDRLLAIGHGLKTWKMRIGDRQILGGDNQSIGLGRAALLDVLADHAADAGVRIEWGDTTTLAEVADAELVIAAEGAGSPTRNGLASELGVTAVQGGLGYIWCGADIAGDSMLFEVVETEHGIFVGHVMPYAADRCTFQIDAVLGTVQRAGLADQTTDPSGNDARSLDYLSGVFARLLEGTALRGNRSVWSTFNTVRCTRWSHGNVVLIGDAAHTAHYSVGSGTRMAMEDALALVDTVSNTADIAEALTLYERQRRPSADRLQDRAVRSQEWWTSFPDRVHLAMPQLMVNYQTRTGAVGATELAATDPDLVAAGLAVLTDHVPERTDVIDRILACPFEFDGTSLPGRVLGPEVHTVEIAADVSRVAEAREANPAAIVLVTMRPQQVVTVEATRKLRDAGADALHVDVAWFDGDVLRCLDVAERLRLLGELPVAVTGDRSELDMLAAGVLGGRTDLLALGGKAAT